MQVSVNNGRPSILFWCGHMREERGDSSSRSSESSRPAVDVPQELQS